MELVIITERIEDYKTIYDIVNKYTFPTSLLYDKVDLSQKENKILETGIKFVHKYVPITVYELFLIYEWCIWMIKDYNEDELHIPAEEPIDDIYVTSIKYDLDFHSYKKTIRKGIDIWGEDHIFISDEEADSTKFSIDAEHTMDEVKTYVLNYLEKQREFSYKINKLLLLYLNNNKSNWLDIASDLIKRSDFITSKIENNYRVEISNIHEDKELILRSINYDIQLSKGKYSLFRTGILEKDYLIGVRPASLRDGHSNDFRN